MKRLEDKGAEVVAKLRCFWPATVAGMSPGRC
jgi:hypothetical protein